MRALIPRKVRRHLIPLSDHLCDAVALIRCERDLSAALLRNVPQHLFICSPHGVDICACVIGHPELHIFLIIHVVEHSAPDLTVLMHGQHRCKIPVHKVLFEDVARSFSCKTIGLHAFSVEPHAAEYLLFDHCFSRSSYLYSSSFLSPPHRQCSRAHLPGQSPLSALRKQLLSLLH